MSRVLEGEPGGSGLRLAIVVSRFNQTLTEKLLAGAREALTKCGVDDDAVDVAWVPGSFEIPVTALRIAQTHQYDAVVCLGAVIRGQTPHFDYIASEVAKGVAQVAMSTGVPTIFGVITADTIEQAVERAGTKAGNKGADAAASAIEMANLFGKLPKGSARK